MKKLKTIEICELPKIKVMAIKGSNIIDTGKECIKLSNLLGVMVELHWNDKVVNIFTTTNIDDIIKKSSKLG